MKQVENFEDIFKSDVGSHSCPNCGEGLLVAKSETGLIIKSRKKKGGKGHGSKDVGNQMEPHKGGKTGSKVKPGPSSASPMGRGVQRKATQPSNPTVEKSEETAPLFPVRKSFAAAVYDGVEDAEIAKSIETTGAGGRIAPQRNIEMERERARQLSKSKSASDADTEADEESSEETDEDSSEDTATAQDDE